MKGKIMTWDEFREMCEMDAQNWAASGYTAKDLTPEDILNEYPEDYFCDSTDDEYDELSSCFTPDEVAIKTLGYLDFEFSGCDANENGI